MDSWENASFRQATRLLIEPIKKLQEVRTHYIVTMVTAKSVQRRGIPVYICLFPSSSVISFKCGHMWGFMIASALSSLVIPSFPVMSCSSECWGIYSPIWPLPPALDVQNWHRQNPSQEGLGRWNHLQSVCCTNMRKRGVIFCTPTLSVQVWWHTLDILVSQKQEARIPASGGLVLQSAYNSWWIGSGKRPCLKKERVDGSYSGVTPRIAL